MVADRLIGRAAEVEALDRALAGLKGGRLAAVELVGEPGIGKTRLLEELAARAEALGALVLQGSASEMELDLPFWVFVDALDEYVHGMPTKLVEALEGDVRAELATVLPSLGSLARGRKVAIPHERYRSHRAVRELLELFARPRPLVLILDDLHWADSASVELLIALLRRPPAAAVLIGLATRPSQTPHRLAAALERARRAGEVRRFELPALTAAESRELLGGTVQAPVAAELYEESGGNPFYLYELALAVRRQLATTATMPVVVAGVQVPAMVAGALNEELNLLTKEARLVLEGAAVVGDPFEPELAAAAANIAESAVGEPLDELLALDLVLGTDVPRRFRFRHPIVRRAVYEGSRRAWRLGAHARTAQALAIFGAAPTVRAHHVERSARRGDPAAVALLREAGKQASLRAPESAARWFKAALEVLPATARPMERIELMLPRAGALAAIGEYSDSYDTLCEGLAIVPVEQSAMRTTLTASCAALEHVLGWHERAGARLRDALDDLPEGDSTASTAFMVELAIDSYYATRYDAMEEWARRALGAAARLDEAPLAASAAALVTLAGAVQGTAEQVRVDCSTAAALVDGLSDDELAARPDSISFLAYAEALLERFAATGRHTDRAIAVARATGQGEQLPLLVATRSTVWLLNGQLTEAAAVLDDAIEAAHLANSPRGLAWVRLHRSAVALAAGDLHLAISDGQEAVDLTQNVDEHFVKAWAGLNLAAALLEGGQPGRALDQLVNRAGDNPLSLIHGGWGVRSLELLTRCHLALGNQHEAAQTAATAGARATALDLPLTSALAGRAAAQVRLDSKDFDSAAKLALQSARGAEQAGAPIETALSRIVAGRALALSGDRDQALEVLHLAADELDRRGAVRYCQAAEHELRALGQRVHRRSRANANATGVELLTGRELQIARLVADGMTNPEIATAQFISVKTVETHLRNAFHKLDVTSRLQLARQVDDQPLA